MEPRLALLALMAFVLGQGTSVLPLTSASQTTQAPPPAPALMNAPTALPTGRRQMVSMTNLTVDHVGGRRMAVACDAGYYDTCGGHEKYWACGSVCASGVYWVDGTCRCCCQLEPPTPAPPPTPPTPAPPAACAYDYTHLGAADCDAAWDLYSLPCQTLEDTYSWICTGCVCPGDDMPTTSWTQHTMKHCSGEILVGYRYSTVALAQSQCSTMSTCWGVYDVGCDESSYDVFLCNASTIATYSDLAASSSSCVFEKPPSPMWAAVSGECTLDGLCVESPNYPQSYSNSQTCTLEINLGSAEPTILVETFDTEAYFDVLIVNGVSYSGTSGPTGVTPTETVIWSSDASVVSNGWRLCATTTPAPTPAPPPTPPTQPPAPPAVCVSSYIVYGVAADCDIAWYVYSLPCQTLESSYSWDCTGCSCPGDVPAPTPAITPAPTQAITRAPTPAAPAVCVHNYTANGAADCDAAWDLYSLPCQTLESSLSWDCTGCSCPGDVPAPTPAITPAPTHAITRAPTPAAPAVCVHDYTANGAADCDAAWDLYSLPCQTLEDYYSWDCTGCSCPGDVLAPTPSITPAPTLAPTPDTTTSWIHTSTATVTSTTTPLWIVSSRLEFSSTGTTEQVTSTVTSLLTVTLNLEEDHLTVAVLSDSSNSASRRLSALASWEIGFGIVVPEQSAQEMFQAVETMSADSNGTAFAMSAVFESEGLELDEGSLVVTEPEMKIVTVTMTTQSATSLTETGTSMTTTPTTQSQSVTSATTATATTDSSSRTSATTASSYSTSMSMASTETATGSVTPSTTATSETTASVAKASTTTATETATNYPSGLPALEQQQDLEASIPIIVGVMILALVCSAMIYLKMRRRRGSSVATKHSMPEMQDAEIGNPVPEAVDLEQEEGNHNNDISGTAEHIMCDSKIGHPGSETVDWEQEEGNDNCDSAHLESETVDRRLEHYIEI